MKRDFIYFFKHKDVNAVKIGRTSGDSVKNRFSQFKTYSPFGSEIVGFFECDNCVELEKKIHIELKQFRMHGEFFNITLDHAKSIINKHDISGKELKFLFNEWLSNPENNVEELQKLFKRANETIKVIRTGVLETKEFEAVRASFTHGETFMITTDILKNLEGKSDGVTYNLNFIGAALRKMNFKRVSSKGKKQYGYLVKELN